MADENSISKDLTLEEFGRFRDFIHHHSGIYLEDTKTDSLRISLITRATRHQFRTLDEYFHLLSSDEDEFKELLNLVTINETSFFRFPAQFDALRDTIIPEIAERKAGGNRQMRVWSAGCSTGEEPYTIAMTLADSGIPGLGWQPQVLGTDVSTKALKVARTAVYPEKALLNLPPEVVARHFEQVPEGHRVAASDRRIVEFGYHNLIKEPYPLALMGNWDVIFCRNVTIYFRLESTKRVVQNFFNCLNEGGYLFIGHSETLTSITDSFEAREIGGVFLYRKPTRTRLFHFPRIEGRPFRSREHGKSAERTHPVRAESPKREPALGTARGPAPAEEGNDIAAMLAQARKHSAAGEPRKALEDVHRVIETDPNNADAYILAAYAHADIGDYDAALSECSRALAINPLLPGARYILGIIHQRQGDQVRAISEFKKTIYIDAEFALAHFNLGNIFKAQGKNDVACREYENALRALKSSAGGQWQEFLGGFDAAVLAVTCERSLLECRKATKAR
ncbi:MAG: hypothetical protein C0418_01355 [Coriobacteriaceae bacterium]|nr:hypothetical protein [Coriobacteriaceae bacterium]